MVSQYSLDKGNKHKKKKKKRNSRLKISEIEPNLIKEVSSYCAIQNDPSFAWDPIDKEHSSLSHRKIMTLIDRQMP